MKEQTKTIRKHSWRKFFEVALQSFVSEMLRTLVYKYFLQIYRRNWNKKLILSFRFKQAIYLSSLSCDSSTLAQLVLKCNQDDIKLVKEETSL